VTLYQILLIFWRRGWILALTLLTTASVAGSVLLMVPGRYDAVATANVDPSASPLTEGSPNSNAGYLMMQGSLISLAQSQRVALDVVKRLNLVRDPGMQAAFRASDSFGRESIENWIASTIQGGLDPKFQLGADVMEMKYKSGDPNQAALMANAFLASTIDATIAMKVASGEQVADWYTPRIAELHKELAQAQDALNNFQTKANVAPGRADVEASTLMSISTELENARSALRSLETRLASGSTDISLDPSDPDLQLLAGFKEKLSEAQTAMETAKSTLGANNPKMVAETANINALRKQITDVTGRMQSRLKEKIATVQKQISQLEDAQGEAQKRLNRSQAERNQLVELQRDLGSRLEQLTEEERRVAQAKLRSKLTLADITVLDKAVPPTKPAFPKPQIVIPAGVGAGLALGLILALLAEMLDRRVRVPEDLAYVAPAPVLGQILPSRRVRLPRRNPRPLLASPPPGARRSAPGMTAAE
jgi:uncharacterized protein involved in exopolysaccharide biosynthesis